MNHLALPALEWSPICLPGRTNIKLDVFKHSISATDGLPPYAHARIIDLISKRLRKTRPTACLWVSVDAIEYWFILEIRRLVKYRIPISIQPSNKTPVDDWDFRPYATPHYDEVLQYPSTTMRFNPRDYGIKESTLRVLRVLARLKTGHTPEIASLAGFSKTQVRRHLKQLQAANLIDRKKIGKYEGWEIKTKGMRLAHRSWNIPKGAHFAPYRREFRYAGERHRRVARMWRVWLETAYPYVKILDCWTEVSLHYGIPDALAWGYKYNREYLFWLEVDSGHSSKKVMERNYRRRLFDAYLHSKEWGIPIVFCIMGPPWVVEYFPNCIPRLYPNLAIIGHDWRDFGRLPIFELDRWHQDLTASAHWRKVHSDENLKFNPKKYPPKKKIKEALKQAKQKSIKPRFMDHSFISDDRDWERDPNDR